VKRLNNKEVRQLAKMRALRDQNYSWEDVAVECGLKNRSVAMARFTSLVAREAETERKSRLHRREQEGINV